MDPASAASLSAKVWKILGGNRLVASLLRPAQIKREGEAEIEIKVKERLALTQAERDAKDILNGTKSYSVEQWRLISHATEEKTEMLCQPSAGTSNEGLASAALNAFAAEKIQKEVNVAKAALFAEEIIQSKEEPFPEAEPSADWISRWRQNTEIVSDEDMQELWGRILAGEIRSPGAFSLRTLEAVKNMSREDAELVSRLAHLRTKDYIFYPEDRSYLSQLGLSFLDLLELQDLGIIAGVETGLTLQFTLSESNPPEHFAFRKHVVRAVFPNTTKQFSLPILTITKLGKEVLSLAQAEDDLRYIRQLKETLTSLGGTVTVHHLNGDLYNPNKVVEV